MSTPIPISIRPGSRFAQLGVTIEILDIGPDFLVYRCSAAGFTGPPMRCSMSFFRWQLDQGVLAPVETIQ